jgi:hypothetical protein
MDFVVGQNTGPSSLGRIAPPHSADDWASKFSSRTAHDQPHAIAIALDPQAVAVIFDLMEPVWAAGSVRVRLPSSLTRRLGNAMRTSQKSKCKKAKANRSLAYLTSTLSSSRASSEIRLNALAIARTDQSRNVQWTHPLPGLMTQPVQERHQPAFEFVFPFRHGQPSKSRPPMNH